VLGSSGIYRSPVSVVQGRERKSSVGDVSSEASGASSQSLAQGRGGRETLFGEPITTSPPEARRGRPCEGLEGPAMAHVGSLRERRNGGFELRGNGVEGTRHGRVVSRHRNSRMKSRFNDLLPFRSTSLRPI
jgi:hypothetical protein